MAAKVIFTGISAQALTTTALAMPIGQQKSKYVADVLAALGTNPIFEIRVGASPVYRTTVPTSIPVSAGGIALPATLAEPPSLNTSADLSGADVTIVLRNATNTAIAVSTPLRAAGDPANYLLASKSLNGTDLVRLVGVLLKPPSNLDVVGTPTGEDPDWLQVALSDMRKNPTTGSFNYMQSYAVNDHKPLHRTEKSYSAQYDRANLVMNRYPNPNAFNESINPDAASELSYLSANDPRRFFPDWNRIIPWSQVFLSEEQQTSTRHAPGYVGNTSVLMWDAQLWVKRTSGIWTRLQRINPTSAEAWRPSFQEGPSDSNLQRILNWNGTGYSAFRPDPILGLDSGGRYWIAHPYGGMMNWDTSNVAEMLVSWRMSLVMVNVNGTDDRDFSRFLAAVGGDYYAPQSTGGSGTYLLGMGTSRHKYVRAKWPAFQYHVMHTASWNGLAGSYPDVNS